MRSPRTRLARRTVLMVLVVALLVLAAAASASAAKAKKQPAGRWVAGDIHTHTWLTDGKNTEAEVIRNAFENFGLELLRQLGARRDVDVQPRRASGS